MARRKQKSCHPCRSRHLKCDGELPCMHCKRSGRDCSKDDNHIFLNESNLGITRRRKYHSLSFDGDQRWIDLPTSVKFAEPAGSVSSAESSAATTPTPSRPSRQPNSPKNLEFYIETSVEDSFTVDPSLQEVSADFFAQAQAKELSSETVENPFFTMSDPTIQWPLDKYQEALLMRHFVQNLACWFDSLDGAKHFTVTVPQLATESEALLNAVLALSTKHLSLLGKLSESISLRYIDACYQALLPDLHTKAMEVDHLAAVLILRFVIHMTDQRDTGLGNDVHLGEEVFLTAWREHPGSSFHAQLFFNVLRLYIHNSWMTRQALPEAEDDLCSMICALGDSNNQARSHNYKASVHAARCVNFAYGDEPRTWERWLKMNDCSGKLAANRPRYLEPIYSQHVTDGQPFPARAFASELYAWHHQYHALARILLLNNQPTSPPPPGHDIVVLSQKQIEEETMFLTRKIIGTALSHNNPMLIFISTLAITYGGHLLTDTTSQDHAYSVLQRVRTECAGAVPAEEFTRLRRAWGWDMDDTVAYQNVL